jgi:N-acyl amino acid synthase of PEP-CTERM/exosortase system
LVALGAIAGILLRYGKCGGGPGELGPALSIKPLEYQKKISMDLVTPYREFFEIVAASTDALREEVFRLRYDVYCRELRWEDAAAFPDGLERDAYDAASIHCLLRHRGSGLYAGTVRLVVAAPDSAGPAIPLLDHCQGILFPGPSHPSSLKPGSFGEISRLALRREFRQRAGEAATADGHGTHLFEWQQDERRRFPHIALGLYLAASAVGLAKGLDGVFAMMEPRLARHLHYGGIHFDQVGEAVEFRGTRAPYFISRQMLFQHLSPALRALLHAIADDLNLQVNGG